MKKYAVSISRTYIHSATINVEAENEEQAEQKALAEIGNHDMSIKSIDENEDYAEVLYEISKEV